MATWNPADKTAALVLSNGNLTAAHTASGEDTQGVRGTLAHDAGKRYFEVVVDALSGASVWFIAGVNNAGADISFFGTLDSWLYVSDGSTYGDGASGSTFATFAAADVVCVAVDLDAGKVWFGKNGSWLGSGDPATGANPAFTFSGETLFPYVQFASESTGSFQGTGAFALADMAYPPPDGFLAWDEVALGYAEAPTQATVAYPRGVAEAPTRALVYNSGVAEAPTRAVVLSSTTTRQWTATVVLDGVDVSARLEGVITVTAEEGAARVARFNYKPSPGVIDPTSWTGAPVTIDIVRVFGALLVPTRVFTGVVDEANFDEIEQLVSFDCTDDLQNKVAALTKAEVDALVGGRYHVGVQGDIAEHWAYAQARMESVAGSLDCGPYGDPRVTLWDGRPVVFDFTGAAHVLGDTSPPAWKPQRRAGLVNEVLLTLKYRYYMCRERHAWLAWSKSVIGVDALASAYQYPTQQMVESALDGSGWKRLYAAFGNAPAQVPLASPAGYYVECSGVANMAAHMAQRHAQTVTEVHTIAVRAPASIEANGLLSRPMRAVVEPDWTPDEWEQDFSVTTPDASGGGAGGEAAYAGTATRAEFEACYLTAVDVARVKILSSHRRASQEFPVPAMPEADLTWGAQITSGPVTASGKVARLMHTVNIDAGTAETLLVLALSGLNASGVVTPTTIAAPAAPDVEDAVEADDWPGDVPALVNHVGAVTNHAYDDDLMGFLVNAPQTFPMTNGTDTLTGANPYYDAAWEYPTTGFRVRMPGVRASHRNPVEIPLSEEIDIEIPVDSLTLTVS